MMGQHRLRRGLAKGKYGADTLVRASGESDWRPIGSVPELSALATEVVVEKEKDSQKSLGARRWHRIQGLLWHAGTWAIVSYLFLPRVAVLFWGLAVAIHALAEIPKILAGPPQKAAPAPLPRSRAIGIWANQEQDPFLKELEAALQALQQAGEKNALPGNLDLSALREAAKELRKQHLALTELAQPATREKLVQERDSALAQAGQAQDARTIEVLQEQARSVTSRLEALQQASDAAARLQARERTLLHQIEAVRLAVLQSGAEQGGAPDLAAEVQRLQLDLKAEAEIEATLAKARIGTGQTQRI
jgi:hypothetical protein